MATPGKAQITLLTAGTPNGHKASIMLEELGIPYETKAVAISKNEQKQDWFTKINPNGRIPAIVDHNHGDLPVFESGRFMLEAYSRKQYILGAILIHLAEQYDKTGQLLPKDVRKRAEVLSWLMWQMGGQGPMQGQANHFFRYAPEKIEYGINRYQNETKRLYGVMEEHLKKGHKYLAADQYSIADIACLSWAFSAPWAGVELDGAFPNVAAWRDRVMERPAVQKGLDVPERNWIKEALADPEKAKAKADAARGMMISTDRHPISLQPYDISYEVEQAGLRAHRKHAQRQFQHSRAHHLVSTMATPGKAQITLLTAGTPNGHKASIMLEELGIPYETKPIAISKMEQKQDWFTKINPNGRIPAIVDHSHGDLPVFESGRFMHPYAVWLFYSLAPTKRALATARWPFVWDLCVVGAILIHLAEQYDKTGQLLPKDVRKRAEVLSWLMWYVLYVWCRQMGGQGPMQGQATHFFRYAPEKIEYGINRYQNETKRLYGVMEEHLKKGHHFLAADQYSIADIACLSWAFTAPWAGLDIDGPFPNVAAWRDRVMERPAVQKGLDVPERNWVRETLADPEKVKARADAARGMSVSTDKQ
eukprot:jgi/Astpho2/3660/Aster-07862